MTRFFLLLWCAIFTDTVSAQVIRANPFYVSPEDVTVAPATDSLIDQVTGALVAFSTRLLDVNYTGNAIRVRRSSDNTEQNIGFVNGNLDTVSLIGFANDTVVRYTSNFTAASTDGWAATNGTVTSNVDNILGVNDVLRFNSNTTSGQHNANKSVGFVVSQRYKVKFDYYIPSTNPLLNNIFITTIGVATTDTFAAVGYWATDSIVGVAASTTLQVRGQNNLTTSYAGSTSDTFYLKNVVVTDLGTNTDLFITTWYNQADSSGVFGTRNFTQTSAAAQPRIMDDLKIDRINDVPSIYHSAVSINMTSAFNPSSLLTGDLTYYFLIRRTSTPTFPTIIGTRSETLNRGRDVYMKSDNNYRMAFSIYGADYCATTTNNTINTNYFFAANLSGTTGSNYVNNTLDCSGSLAGQLAPNATSFYVGRRVSGNGFIGYINEIIVYGSDKNSSNTTVYDNVKNYYGL